MGVSFRLLLFGEIRHDHDCTADGAGLIREGRGRDPGRERLAVAAAHGYLG